MNKGKISQASYDFLIRLRGESRFNALIEELVKHTRPPGPENWNPESPISHEEYIHQSALQDGFDILLSQLRGSDL